MFDLILLFLGVLFCMVGIVGSFIPIIPGPLTSWFGILVLNFTSAVDFNLYFVIMTLIVAVVISAFDYIIPIVGVKKLGGSIVNPPALSDNGRFLVMYCHDIDGILMEIVEEL